MQTRPFGKLGFNVSTLGFGCMRLPLEKPAAGAHGNVVEEGHIDEEAAITMIRYAIDRGVSYIDTAYNYHSGQSELVVGKALANGYRQKVKLATKLPCWLVKEPSDFDRLLNEQLKKLNTDHIDFYLLHALRKEVWDRMKNLGVLEFLDRAVADGRIKYPSFSIHDSFKVFKEILDSYNWSMCQIQLNYMNEDYQAGLEGLQYAGYKEVPVVIMEPLLGGKLAKEPPAEIQAVWNKARKRKSPAEWAFRWVSSFPETTVVLSGMTTMEQVVENLKIFKECKAHNLDEHDSYLIDQVRKMFRERMVVSCTSCRYCLPCPQRVSIPHILNQYNDHAVYGSVEGAFLTYTSLMSSGTDASRCVECGKCEEHCPQGIPIIQFLKDAHEILAK